jgi:hypothetical protein
MNAPHTEAGMGGDGVDEFLTQSVVARRGFASVLGDLAEDLRIPELPRSPQPATGRDHISKLFKRVNDGPSIDRPELVTVSGVFYPAVLLTPGIRAGSDPVEGAKEIVWRTPLQRWLFSGFEEWAPSWDLNTPDGDDQPLFGQLGYEDEAYSLLVIVTGPRAGHVREKLLEAGEMVSNVELTGALIHRSHVEAQLPKGLDWENKFDYCLGVNLSQGHRIERAGPADPYSGYLWECVVPKQWMQGRDVPEFTDSFFVWEHTDFASTDSQDYGLDALKHKHGYIEERFGELQLVQKSAPIVPGDPVLDTKSFYTVLERGPA